jgi:hypothetical protein
MTDTFVQDPKTLKWSITKDPDAVLDYVEDWTAWLDGVTDTIANAVVTVTSGVTPASNVAVNSSLVSGKTVRAWISGGSPDETVAVRYRITTNNVPARIDDRTVYLKIKER